VKILGLDRVELLVDAGTIGPAVERMNEVFGFRLSPPEEIPGHGLLSSVDFDAGLEFVAPMGPGSSVTPPEKGSGRGALLTVVWEVDDIASARRFAEEKGLTVILDFENESVKQLCLSADEFFGYTITLMERKG